MFWLDFKEASELGSFVEVFTWMEWGQQREINFCLSGFTDDAEEGAIQGKHLKHVLSTYLSEM